MRRLQFVFRGSLLLALLLLASFETRADDSADRSQPPTPSVAEEGARPRIEVAFVLDTTGSMSGLIAAAKEKIWSIANTLASSKPTPDLKLALIGYRDRGDDYITKVYDFSDDLDPIYKELMAFAADGGGDGPESVNQALHEAVTKLSWSQDEAVYRVIFLVGDAPPHMDYPDDVKYPEVCKLAAKADITINTIQCGGAGNTRNVWQQIAKASEGAYFQVSGGGDAVVMDTPYDAKMAELARELDDTKIAYGDREAKRGLAEKAKLAASINRDASTRALAQRAAFNAVHADKATFLGVQELVHDFAAGKVKLEELDEKELPEELARLDLEGRKKVIVENQQKREALRQEIAKLAEQRQTYLKDQLAKGAVAKAGAASLAASTDSPAGRVRVRRAVRGADLAEAEVADRSGATAGAALKAGEALEDKLFSAIRAQAAEKGVEYAEDAEAAY